MDYTGKVLTMKGEYESPLDGKMVHYRMVTRIIDENKHVFEMYEKKEGKEVKGMEITYTRR